MAAKRKKLKADLDYAMFGYEDNEELMEYFKTVDTDRGRLFNVCVDKVTLDKLSSKWNAVIGPYMAVVKDCDEEPSQDHKLLVEEYKTKYKTLRKDFAAVKK